MTRVKRSTGFARDSGAPAEPQALRGGESGGAGAITLPYRAGAREATSG